MTAIKKIGFACKYLHSDRSLSKKILETFEKPLNYKTTTNKWLIAQPRDVAYERMMLIVEHNLAATERLINYVSTLPVEQHMVRLGSDILPFYTHHNWKNFYSDSTVSGIIATKLGDIGASIKRIGIKISFHPGQFCVLGSHDPNIVDRSIEEFEYHVHVLKLLGFCKTFQDAKCNVHISGKGGVAKFLETVQRLSPEARKVITVENEEFVYGLEDVLLVSDICPIVLDIHHHWIKTGEYIQPDCYQVQQVLDSWRGIRPTMHYSLSKEDLISHLYPSSLPDMNQLLKLGFKKSKLRAHSTRMWNKEANTWALSFSNNFDIMVEAKDKNLASGSMIAQYCNERM